MSKVLKLSLDNPHRVYSPGSTITGQVELCGNVTDTHIILQGIAKSNVIGESHGIKFPHRARAPLLYERLPLQRNGDVTTGNDDIANIIPFAIKIPERVAKIDFVPTPPEKRNGFRSGYWEYENSWKQAAEYQNERAHPLPPTCRFGPRGIKTKYECSIEYSIAVVGTPTAQSDRSRTGTDGPNGVRRASEQQQSETSFDNQQFWLQMAPTRPAQPQYSRLAPRMMGFHSMRLLPEHASTTKLTFKQRFRTSVESSLVPHAAFEVSLQRPRYVEVGSKITFLIHVTPCKAGPERLGRKTKNSVPMPSFTLVEMESQIRAETGVRRAVSEVLSYGTDWTEPVFRCVDENDSEQPSLSHWSAEDFEADLAASGVPHPAWVQSLQSTTTNNSAPDLSHEITLKQAIPDRLMPTFSTYNVYRKYEWQVWLTFECAGTLQKVHFQMSLALLPQGSLVPHDNMDWGAYKLEPEHELLKHIYAGLALDVGGFVIDLLSNLL